MSVTPASTRLTTRRASGSGLASEGAGPLRAGKAAAAAATPEDSFKTLVARGANGAVRLSSLQAPVAQTGGASLAPDVQRAVEEVRNEKSDYGKAQAITYYLDERAGDQAWRDAFLRELGPQVISKAVNALDPAKTPTGTPDWYAGARILGGAGRALDSWQLREVLLTAGPASRGIVAHGLYYSETNGPVPLDLRPFLADFAAGAGRLADTLGPRDSAVFALLAPMMSSKTQIYSALEVHDSIAAGWLVAHSGSDALKLDFVDHHSSSYRPRVAGASELARALALVIGSMSSPVEALRVVVELDGATRRAFLADAVTLDGVLGPDSFAFALQGDVSRGIASFFGKVGQLDLVMFPGEEVEARNFRVEVFRAGASALEHAAWSYDTDFKRALAALFNSDTATIVHALADTTEGSPLTDVEGRLMARFVEKVVVAKDDPQSQGWALGALREYIGVGQGDGDPTPTFRIGN